jgi:hypothetical protein
LPDPERDPNYYNATKIPFLHRSYRQQKDRWHLSCELQAQGIPVAPVAPVELEVQLEVQLEGTHWHQVD